MTKVGTFVYTLISTIPTSPVGLRCYPMGQAPQKVELPRVTYQVISTQPWHHLQGTSPRERARVQINCWAATPAAAHTLADTIQAAMDSYRGTLSGVDVRVAQIDNRQELPAAPSDGSEQATSRVALDFFITYSTSGLALHT